MSALVTTACLIDPHIDLPPTVGLPTLTLVPAFFDIQNFKFAIVVLPCELQPLIEDSVWVFNLVGVVVSHETLIY